MMPLTMLRNNVMHGRRDGIREATLLARSWGVTRDWIVHTVMHMGCPHCQLLDEPGNRGGQDDVLEWLERYD